LLIKEQRRKKRKDESYSQWPTWAIPFAVLLVIPSPMMKIRVSMLDPKPSMVNTVKGKHITTYNLAYYNNKQFSA